MVYLKLRPFSKTGAQVSEALLAEGILTLSDEHMMRLVTHRDVSTEEAHFALDCFRRTLQASS
jgi:hypothetical protein